MISEFDREVVEAFENFLSWNEPPARKGDAKFTRNWSPAVYAYALGHTMYCPPVGVL